jgi:hypothetical protein
MSKQSSSKQSKKVETFRHEATRENISTLAMTQRQEFGQEESESPIGLNLKFNLLSTMCEAKFLAVLNNNILINC